MSESPKRAAALVEYERLRKENIQARREYYDELDKVEADSTRPTSTLSSLADHLEVVHKQLLGKAGELGISPQFTAHLFPYKEQ
ncbi:hypothetical protein [Burkholderia cepacia]|uniref:hypothetical protein n=1 Tax=Burkholderia cepacia TaxID=292 RepID=UPI0012D998EF|nr:hypothetical protein [Burkholderia cepacia]